MPWDQNVVKSDVKVVKDDAIRRKNIRRALPAEIASLLSAALVYMLLVIDTGMRRLMR